MSIEVLKILELAAIQIFFQKHVHIHMHKRMHVLLAIVQYVVNSKPVYPFLLSDSRVITTFNIILDSFIE